MNKNVDKKIEFKDYLHVVVMFIITIIVVLALRYLHISYKKYDLKNPVIRGKIQELHVDEFKDYLTEHDDFFMYVCNSWNKSCRDVEKKLPSLLEKRNIKTNTIYLNSGIGNKDNDDIETQNKVISVLNSIGYKKDSFNIPLFLIIYNKRVVAFTKNDENKFTIENIEELLDAYEIGA